MKWSKYFIPTLKEVPVGTEAVSHQLLLRAGLVQMLTSGVYSYLPLGLKVLNRVENIIREEMNNAGAHELLMPCLHPIELWKKTGRDQVLDGIMIKFKNNRGHDMCLGPTHEEIITDLVRQFVQSYRQLPVTLYQIQTKFRDELRTRFGIVRASEFIMKDAYSFDRDVDGLRKSYQIMFDAYKRIFSRMELDVAVIAADSGAMGGDVSHEFMIGAPIGEDAVVSCPSCKAQSGVTENQDQGKTCPQCGKGILTKQSALELGHIFQLGTKYSSALAAEYIDEDGKRNPMIMGCYGIGVSRVVAAIIEKYNDDKGIKWPASVAPFDVEILPIAKSADDEIMKLSEKFYSELRAKGCDVLMDDRSESAGRKFNDADLIGIPLRITIGQRNLVEGKVEIKLRQTGEVMLVEVNDVLMKIMELKK
ncbi:MAG: proline--tRNA ligase [Candidatus Omnitrophica bacterium]|nr:proline--tRNA ligase [Candidatus Omnitrophota bacterium]